MAIERIIDAASHDDDNDEKQIENTKTLNGVEISWKAVEISMSQKYPYHYDSN